MENLELGSLKTNARRGLLFAALSIRTLHKQLNTVINHKNLFVKFSQFYLNNSEQVEPGKSLGYVPIKIPVLKLSKCYRYPS